jgi:hypothetical protein
VLNPEKTKYMLLSNCKKGGQKYSIKVANRFWKIWQRSNIWEQNQQQNCANEEIRSRLNSGNSYYHSIQSILSSRLLSRKVKFEIHKTIILTKEG